MILQVSDLYKYSIALQNSGITPENLAMLERQAISVLFGREGARNLIKYLNENTIEVVAEGVGGGSVPGFGGDSAPPSEPSFSYGDLTELVEGDNVLFSGLRALLSVLSCMNLLSQNRVQVARQNVQNQPNSSRPTTRREESDVVQGLSYTAQNIIYAMDDYLKQKDKNPLNLQVNGAVIPSRYSTDTSGRMPQNTPYFMGFFGFMR